LAVKSGLDDAERHTCAHPAVAPMELKNEVITIFVNKEHHLYHVKGFKKSKKKDCPREDSNPEV